MTAAAASCVPERQGSPSKMFTPGVSFRHDKTSTTLRLYSCSRRDLVTTTLTIRNDAEMRIRREPAFSPLMHPAIALQLCVSLEHLGIGAALRLGHRKRRYDFVQSSRRLQIFFLLLGRPVMVSENLRRLTLHRVGRCGHPNDDFHGAVGRASQNLVHEPELIFICPYSLARRAPARDGTPTACAF